MRGQLLRIDGSHGEGGGQILRSSLALSAITGRPIRIENIRANRPNPGLAAEHLTAVLAIAEICNARVDGAELDSQQLQFIPQAPIRAGDYCWDVAKARPGGSAGAATLVLHAAFPTLALAAGPSVVHVGGGTHVDWSPSFDYLSNVWAPMQSRMGVSVEVELDAWGWFPAGGGQITARISREAPDYFDPLTLLDKGALQVVRGRAVAANLPAHIAQRMADRARAMLVDVAPSVHIEPERVRAGCPGAGIFLTAEYENSLSGFSALGRQGKPSEAVAEEVVEALIDHGRSAGALDRHLADQLLIPMALADGDSCVTVETVSNHLSTNAWLIAQFDLAKIAIDSSAENHATVTVRPRSDNMTARRRDLD